MKGLAKNLLVHILGGQAKRLCKKNNITVIGVVGSIGKTSTKFAIASMLATKHKVQWQQGNYNDILSVPLIFFGQSMPSITNPFAWLRIIFKNEQVLRRPYQYDVVVVELGTDGPGQIVQFKRYLKLDIAVITSVSPEHMEHFNDIDAVASEELSVSVFSERLIANSDLVASAYRNGLKNITTYGLDVADIKIKIGQKSVELTRDGHLWCELKTDIISKVTAYSVAAGAVVADTMGLESYEIEQSMRSLQTPSGRMQIIPAINNATIIDETYNASPDAVIEALDYLYAQKAPQRIALLGNMNELGKFSKFEHERVGNYCNPKKLDYVITLGPDANEFLAPKAKQNGCAVESFTNPYKIGEFLKDIIKDRAIILAKGSQNNVYMEEAIKPILANSADQDKLVRQSSYWLKKKRRNFTS